MPDWTKVEDFDWKGIFSRRDWAWEFLRRNPDFRTSWQSARLEWGIAGYQAQTTVIVSLQQIPVLAE
jgi:hypothetical protein